MGAFDTVVGSIMLALDGGGIGVSFLSDWGVIVGGSSVMASSVSSDRSGSVSWPTGLVRLVGIRDLTVPAIRVQCQKDGNVA